MGAVYRARDLRFTATRIVAVKEMINQARDSLVRDTIVKNFEREANILASLNHISIPKIHDYFTINDRSYLVMEFVQGNNLPGDKAGRSSRYEDPFHPYRPRPERQGLFSENSHAHQSG